MLAVTGDAILTAAAGVITSLIIAGGALYGVIYNARAQQLPRRVKVDPAELERLEAQVRALELEVERWKGAALAALSRDRPQDRAD